MNVQLYVYMLWKHKNKELLQQSSNCTSDSPLTSQSSGQLITPTLTSHLPSLTPGSPSDITQTPPIVDFDPSHPSTENSTTVDSIATSSYSLPITCLNNSTDSPSNASIGSNPHQTVMAGTDITTFGSPKDSDLVTAESASIFDVSKRVIIKAKRRTNKSTPPGLPRASTGGQVVLGGASEHPVPEARGGGVGGAVASSDVLSCRKVVQGKRRKGQKMGDHAD